jgi:hypothetical protein
VGKRFIGRECFFVEKGTIMKSFIEKVLFIAAAFFVVFFGCANPDSSTNAVSSLSVITPDTTGAWEVGTMLNIRWKSMGSVGSSVAIDLFNDTGFVVSVSAATVNNGAFTWSIPRGMPPAETYRIKIGGAQPAGVFGFSESFTISNNHDDYEPDGSSSLATVMDTAGAAQRHRISVSDTDWFKFPAQKGRTYCIQTHGDAHTALSLYAAGATTLLVSDTGNRERNNALLVWSSPTSAVYFFKVASRSGKAGIDYTITITSGPAYLIITYPTGSIPYMSSGETLPITWAHSVGSGGAVILRLFRGDTLASAIAASALNTGAYNWIIPRSLPTSSKYRVVIYSSADTSVSDAGGLFTIMKTPALLAITAPSAPANWKNGETHSITWTYSGDFGPYIGLTLCDSSSTPVSSITGSYSAAMGSYSWTIPASIPPGEYRIKIYGISDTSINSFSAAVAVTKAPSTLSISTPSAASSWNTGSSYSIYWSYTGSPGAAINLALCDSALTTVATIAGNAYLSLGSYYWTIPPTVTSGEYRIKIYSASDTSINGFSAAFSIAKTPSTLKITTPSAGSSWNTATSQYIYWTYTGSPGSYVSLLLYDSTALVTTITPSYSLSYGSYYWSIPTVLPNSTKYRIRIASTTDTSISGFSDRFAITKPVSTLTVTTPSALSSWITGTSYSIYWTLTGNPGSYVSLSLYDSSATTVAASIVNVYASASGYYTWTVPSSVATGKYRIKISSISDTSVKSFSSPFTITKAPSLLVVTAPSASTSWIAGTSQTIFWAYSGASCSYVNIRLYNSTALRSVIASSANLSTGYYTWSIPSTLPASSTYRIKISCTSDTAFSSTSPDFTISPTR